MHFVLFLYVHMFGGRSDTLFGGKSVFAAGPRAVRLPKHQSKRGRQVGGEQTEVSEI